VSFPEHFVLLLLGLTVDSLAHELDFGVLCLSSMGSIWVAFPLRQKYALACVGADPKMTEVKFDVALAVI
jgi:hypothetical protein